MDTYKKKIATNDKVELIMVSYDNSIDDAASWAKKESMPWPTLLTSSKENTRLVKEPIHGVPSYRLYSNDGKLIAEGKKDVFSELKNIK